MSYSETGNSTNFTMPVAPYGGGGFGNDFLGGNGAWWLIILLLFCNNGWGNGFGFSGGMLPMMMPKPIGTSSNGSNSFIIPRAMKTRPMTIIMICPQVQFPKPE